jgi:hypothetical protein
MKAGNECAPVPAGALKKSATPRLEGGDERVNQPRAQQPIPILTPLKAVRAKCLDCCCGQRKEVRQCQILDCPLWHYRMGRRPARIRENMGLGASLSGSRGEGEY